MQTMPSANRSANERPTNDTSVSVTALTGNSSAANRELVPAADRGRHFVEATDQGSRSG